MICQILEANERIENLNLLRRWEIVFIMGLQKTLEQKN